VSIDEATQQLDERQRGVLDQLVMMGHIPVDASWLIEGHMQVTCGKCHASVCLCVSVKDVPECQR